MYPGLWVTPELTDNQYPADELVASKTYAIAPGPVTAIAVITDIIDSSGIGLGIIQASWTAGTPNGSPITTYTCNLYTVSGGERSPPIRTITTTDTNCLFTDLRVLNTFYSVGIIENNSIGPSIETNYLPNTEIGFPITGSVDGVTNLQGYQTSYDGTDFSGNLTWNYSGPGTGYTNAVFHIYSVVSGVRTDIGTVNYVTGTLNYQFAVSLGTNPNVPKTFAVNVIADALIGTSSSVYSYITITPGFAPIISGVSISYSQLLAKYILTFTVTNNTDRLCIPGSCTSLVMPDPVNLIADFDPVFSGYDTSLIPNPGSYTFQHPLAYQSNPAAAYLITCSNPFGGSAVQDGWGAD